MATSYISKVQLPGSETIYEIKDAGARELISQLHNVEFHKCTAAGDTPIGVEWKDGSTTITGTLTAANAQHQTIYLVPSKHTLTGDVYDEYITTNVSTTSTPSWTWETLGSTQLDIDDLGDFAYADIGSGSGTVSTADSASFSNGSASVSATYTPAGSVSVTLSQTDTAADLTKADYTPAGTVSKPDVTVTTSTMDIYGKKTDGSVSAGTAATFSSGTFSGGSFTQGTDNFTAPTWSASVDANEVLTFSFSAGSFTQGSDTFVAATHGADTFTANTPTAVTLPTFEKKQPLASASAELASTPTFTGTKATDALVTGVTYKKAGVQSSTFTGTEATISSTGTASGTVTLTKTDKTVNVTVAPVVTTP